MRIAVIGLGSVGGALGRGWIKAGHEVVFGVRDPSAAKSIEAAGGAPLATPGEAVAGADAVLLAVPWKAVPATLTALGDLSNVILMDCTNPLSPDLSGLEVSGSSSGGEEVFRLAPGARVVKIFNTTGSDNMADPSYGGSPLTMLLAGDDPGANAVAAGLARDIGFDPVVLGPLSASRLLEPVALTWITLAYRGGLGRDFALQIVRRPTPGGA